MVMCKGRNIDPDCFTEENKHSRPNYTYLPFGEGPRMCIGDIKSFRTELWYCRL